jgi:hypothetical protein
MYPARLTINASSSPQPPRRPLLRRDMIMRRLVLTAKVSLLDSPDVAFVQVRRDCRQPVVAPDRSV